MLLSPERSALVVVDVQERLAPVVHAHDRVVRNVGILLDSASRLGIPTLASEQYPKGLGATVPAVRARLADDAVVEKLHFSCTGEPGFMQRLDAFGRDQIVLTGMEAHVCVLQTALGLRSLGRKVYIVADATIIPVDHEIYYSEKVMRLPCYQANDRKRIVAGRRPARVEVGLPENAFVYCSFNGMQKITQRVFQRWMTILGRVPDSVLWLLTGTDDTNARLRIAAAEHGISPERIVFAQRLPNPEHLARYPLADLFLDSMPYGAHTTAADSLWMNVPVLTLPGRSFAARVCASVVRAAGVGELECRTPEAYIARAVELGQNREKLAAIKAKLAAGRDSCLLFDTPRLVSHLEDLYRQMWSELKRGELPIPDLRNLDVYHDIAVGLAIEDMETLSDDAYVSLYRDKLAGWNSHYPIAPDDRLWRGSQSEDYSRSGRLAVA